MEELVALKLHRQKLASELQEIKNQMFNLSVQESNKLSRHKQIELEIKKLEKHLAQNGLFEIAQTQNEEGISLQQSFQLNSSSNNLQQKIQSDKQELQKQKFVDKQDQDSMYEDSELFEQPNLKGSTLQSSKEEFSYQQGLTPQQLQYYKKQEQLQKQRQQKYQLLIQEQNQNKQPSQQQAQQSLPQQTNNSSFDSSSMLQSTLSQQELQPKFKRKSGRPHGADKQKKSLEVLQEDDPETVNRKQFLSKRYNLFLKLYKVIQPSYCQSGVCRYPESIRKTFVFFMQHVTNHKIRNDFGVSHDILNIWQRRYGHIDESILDITDYTYENDCSSFK